MAARLIRNHGLIGNKCAAPDMRSERTDEHEETGYCGLRGRGCWGHVGIPICRPALGARAGTAAQRLRAA